MPFDFNGFELHRTTELSYSHLRISRSIPIVRGHIDFLLSCINNIIVNTVNESLELVQIFLLDSADLFNESL